MKVVTLGLPCDGRTCKKIITALLKSHTAGEIVQYTYAKHYKAEEKKIIKTPLKVLWIAYDENKTDKLYSIIKQQCKEYYELATK